jgi:2-keto-3-deoxy-L-rhamnonate aldolase RhmA
VRKYAAIALVSVTALATVGVAQTPKPRHNRVIGLLEAKQPVFGLYAPSNRRFPGGAPGAARPATPPASEAPAKSPAELAREAAAYKLSDFVFDGSMEGDFEKSYPAFADFAKGLQGAGIIARTPFLHLTHPMIVKSPELRPDLAASQRDIGRQLNLGVSGIMLVTVETAEEARAGIAAMRFTSKGGVRPDDVGTAPAVWGMSEAEYRRKADVWPLNPEGEIVVWAIIESHEGLANIREIAQVPGLSVIAAGAGTLGGVFSTTNAEGRRVRDDVAWEAAIQKIAAACKEFNKACAYPVNENDIEARYKQGFTVGILQSFNDAAFRAVAKGRQIAGR